MRRTTLSKESAQSWKRATRRPSARKKIRMTKIRGMASSKGKIKGSRYSSRPRSSEQRRPWQSKSHRQREEADMVMNTELTDMLREARGANLVDEPEAPKYQSRDANPKKWCEFHRSAGHSTDDCWTLQREIDKLIRAGYQGNRQGQWRNNGDHNKTHKREEERVDTKGKKKQESAAIATRGADDTFAQHSGPPVGTINTIAGGFGGGGDTHAARKRHVRAVNSVHEVAFGFVHPDITISMADFEGIKPHKDDPIVVQLRMNSFNVRRVLLDQGSSADIIYGDAFDKLGLTDSDLTPYAGTLVGFAGEQVMVRGYIDLDTIFGEDECARVLKVRYLVLQVVASYNVIIGRNTLNRLCAVISTAHLAVKYPLSSGNVGKLKVDRKMARECYNNCLNLYGKKSALVGHRCYEIEASDENLDPRGEGRVNRPTPIEETKALKFGDRTLKIGTRLTEEQETRLTKLLGENLDLFVWSCKDMPGIDPNFICHRLALNPSVKPVSQLRRRLGGDKGKAVQQEVDKLLPAEFIREVKYPTWLANVVMVKKANGKWRMCVDYTDLNKACPKDSYPLPSIDSLVDGASGNELLSLMDAYSGYHQIRMHPADEDKTAFMTARVNYCYRTMPFGLKNAGATNQRLMDRVFAGQVGRNMEVYVDDMIVKSVRGLDHHQDLGEALGEIRKHNMRLNPEKCSFGVQGGKFLGFMITSRGIEINPDKCKAIQQMKSPSNVKEVQRLTGRIAALSRFLPKSGDRSFPFFKCLRKNVAFEWTAECEEAFVRLKELLSSPPILSKPIQGHPLHLYFAVSDSALSSVILQEVDGEH
ncbi:uncharacterized protein LOC130722168 [Lotus japonicus]|uniref:uncharacterized protein LOC130722168 n=1 Tax=Lotus japonicus TaxID=34305 RepID=UPI002583AFE7|nr:uncharacterized protein LOC130722168 [Lotus japonicus]